MRYVLKPMRKIIMLVGYRTQRMPIYALIAAVLPVAKTFNSIHYQDCLPRNVVMIGPFHDCSQSRHAVAKLQVCSLSHRSRSIHQPSSHLVIQTGIRIARRMVAIHPVFLSAWRPSIQTIGQLAWRHDTQRCACMQTKRPCAAQMPACCEAECS